MLTSGGKNTDIAVRHVGAGEAAGPKYTPITATKTQTERSQVCLTDALDKPYVLMNRTDQSAA